MDNALKTKLMKKIKYDKDIYGDMNNFEMVIEDLIEASKHIALSLKYPFLEDYSNIKVPTKYQNWQYRCCIELHKLAGKEGITSYSENGLTVSMENSRRKNSLRKSASFVLSWMISKIRA